MKPISRHLLIFTLILLMTGLLALNVVSAQTGAPTGTCPAVVERALQELEANCTGLGRNSACYGYNRVSATFSQPVEEGYFSLPSDRADLITLDTITTAPMSVNEEEWGIALLNAQANLPGTLPGQSVTFVLLGDASVTNAVPPEEAVLPVDPIRVITASDALLRTGPGDNRNLVAGTTIPAGTELDADALSADSLWTRVVYEELGGWIRVNTLETADLSALPALSDDARTPMQAFLFRTGLQSPLCSEAPNSVVVQGPRNTEIDLNVNGADINVGSTIQLSSVFGNPQTILDQLDLPDDIRQKLAQGEADGEVCQLMRLVVVSGEVLLNEGTFTLPQGYAAWAVFCADLEELPEGEDGQFTQAQLGRFFARINFASPWGAVRPLTMEEWEELRVLERIPLGTINYPIDIPDFVALVPTPTPTFVPAPFGAAGTGGTPTIFNPAAGASGQSAIVGQAFAIPFAVTLLDAEGSPVAGVPVYYTAPSSGPSGTFAGGGNTAQVTSGPDGTATAPTFTGNTAAGTYTVTASMGGFVAQADKPIYMRIDRGAHSVMAQVMPIATFTVTNIAGAASGASSSSGSGQSAVVLTPFSSPIRVCVVDAFGNPTTNVGVTFSAPSAGASGTFGSALSANVQTGGDGCATAPTLTANAIAGGWTLTASISGVGSPVNFSLTNLPGGAPVEYLEAVQGVEQNTFVNTPFESPLVVRAWGPGESIVSGAVITFSAPGSGASATLSSTTAVTDSQGFAQVNATANGIVGSYIVTATAASGASADFYLYNSQDYSGYTLTIIGGDEQSTVVQTAFANPIIAELRDASNQPVPNSALYFSAPYSGASARFGEGYPGNFYEAVTDTNGRATISEAYANSVAGTYTVDVYWSEYSGVSTSFQLTNEPDYPSQIIAYSGSGQTAEVGTVYAAPLVALVTDDYGNPVPNTNVAFIAPFDYYCCETAGTQEGLATVYFASTEGTDDYALTDQNGLATSSEMLASWFPGEFAVVAYAGEFQPAYFSLENTSGESGIPTDMYVTNGFSQTTTVGTGFPTYIEVLVVDSYGIGVQGVSVSFSAPGSGSPGAIFNGVDNDETVITDFYGYASVTVSANTTAGYYDIQVSSAAGSEYLSYENVAGSPASVSILSGDGQIVEVGQPYAPMIVQVLDSYLNPVPGAEVVFSHVSGPETSPLTDTQYTDVSGEAASSAFVAGTSVGDVQIDASSGSASVSFFHSNVPGPLASLSVVGGTGQSALIDEDFSEPVVIMAQDSYGNLVEGATVSFSNTGSPAVIDFSAYGSSAVTDPNGMAFLTVRAGSVEGTASIIAESNGVFSSEITFTITSS
ncbi:hypothetical protein QQ056_17985 [Oscillatoria laete-virens NRMC-F 0139]|nr:hypothetical protein [Oscillatoria laete-virens]MDL5055423.1 hypothetical protein [Oscillatoria laete-virens NRMC-F 0139]